MLSEANDSDDELMDTPLIIDEQGNHGDRSVADTAKTFPEQRETSSAQPLNAPSIKRSNIDHSHQTKTNDKTVIIELKNNNATSMSKLVDGVKIINNNNLMEGCSTRVSLDTKNRHGNINKYIICLQRNPTGSLQKSISVIEPRQIPENSSNVRHMVNLPSGTCTGQTTHLNANGITPARHNDINAGEKQSNQVNSNIQNQIHEDSRKNAHLKINDIIQSNNNILTAHQISKTQRNSVKPVSRYVMIRPKPVANVNINSTIPYSKTSYLRDGGPTASQRYTRSILKPGLECNHRNKEVQADKSNTMALSDFRLPVKVLPVHPNTHPGQLAHVCVNSNKSGAINQDSKMSYFADYADKLRGTQSIDTVPTLNNFNVTMLGGKSTLKTETHDTRKFPKSTGYRSSDIEAINSPGMLGIVNCVPEVDSEVDIVSGNNIETCMVEHDVNKDSNKVGSEFSIPNMFAVENCVPEVFSEANIVTTSTVDKNSIEMDVAKHDDSCEVRTDLPVGTCKTGVIQSCEPGETSKADSSGDDTGVIENCEPGDNSAIGSEVDLVANCTRVKIEIDVDESVVNKDVGKDGHELCDVKTEVLSENESSPSKENSSGQFDDDIPDIKAFLCQGCWAVFDNPISLDEHVCPFRNADNALDETGKRQFTCGHCGKKFNDRYLAKRHLKSHTGVREFHCDICDKSFLLKHQLTNHMESHFENRPFHCQICGAAFKRKAHLFKHRLSHSGTRERKYRCTHCDMAFFMLDKLQRHEATHSLNRQRYVCDICHLQYTALEALNRHMKRTHEEKSLAKKMKKVLRCKYCDAGFFLRKQLTTHLTSHGICVGQEEDIQKYTRKATRQERIEFGKIMHNSKTQKKK